MTESIEDGDKGTLVKGLLMVTNMLRDAHGLLDVNETQGVS